MKFANPVLEAGAQGTWDDFTVGADDVIYDGAIYHMWYSGRIEVGPFRIGYATDSSLYLTVNATGDGGDSNPGDGFCDDGSGDCTLRAAIQEANARSGKNIIAFNIPGPGPHTIQPASALPLIFDPVVIDGTTEPDFAGTPVIELDGSNASNANGIWLSYGAENSMVRGLVINRFVDEAGIHLGATGGHVIEGNYIGTDITGTQARGNKIGVWILYLSSDNIIGGTTPGARNLISGNIEAGVVISESVPTNNVVMGNYIGTDVNGTAAVGNGTGVLIWNGASYNTIGGTIPGAGNVISGNNASGIVIEGNNVTGNLVQGNYIGTQADGNSPLGNQQHGIFFEDVGSNNTIGGAGVTPGTCDGPCNTIAFNGADGVSIADNTGNAILGNAIFSNTDLGIDLGEDGITPNDPGDGDSGANNLQNFPDINSVEIDGNGDLLIDYSVDSDTTHSAYPLAIQFFQSDTLGQGEIFIGEDTYTTTDFNNGGKTINLDNAAGLGISNGDSILATATDNDGNTSEFSSVDIVTGIDIAKLEDFIPKTFDLVQNYPNPFNPSTTIRYDLPKSQFVTLKVYDILGREITTLVKERQAAGSYSVLFDAGQIASGLYFYKITAGDPSAGSGQAFSEIKKMLVMK
jgi:CSLREA domain-containing protein